MLDQIRVLLTCQLLFKAATILANANPPVSLIRPECFWLFTLPGGYPPGWGRSASYPREIWCGRTWRRWDYSALEQEEISGWCTRADHLSHDEVDIISRMKWMKSSSENLQEAVIYREPRGKIPRDHFTAPRSCSLSRGPEIQGLRCAIEELDCISLQKSCSGVLCEILLKANGSSFTPSSLLLLRQVHRLADCKFMWSSDALGLRRYMS